MRFDTNPSGAAVTHNQWLIPSLESGVAGILDSEAELRIQNQDLLSDYTNLLKVVENRISYSLKRKFWIE